MKRLAALFLSAIFLASCGDALIVEPRMVSLDIRSEGGYLTNMIFEDRIKWSELSDVVELSDGAVVAVVRELSGFDRGERGASMEFTYTIEPTEVLFDTTGELTVGGGIEMMSNEGALTFETLAPVLDERELEFVTMLWNDQPENGWMLASMHDVIPIEIGRSYVFFLSKKGRGWTESGREYLWEVMDGRPVTGDGTAKAYDDNYTMEAVREAVTARTGRCDEIGEEAYEAEMLARQTKELADRMTELQGIMDSAAAKRTGEAVPEKERNIVMTVDTDFVGMDGGTLAERLEWAELAAVVKLTERTQSFVSYESASFRYQAEIVDILYDEKGSASVGAEIDISTASGLIRPWEMQEHGVMKNALLLRDRVMFEEYTDRDYIAVSEEGAVPAEVGKTYLMLLREEPLYGVPGTIYIEYGGQFLYEYRDGKLYTGDGKTAKKAKISLKDIEKAIGALE